jgi:hypothetical protein
MADGSVMCLMICTHVIIVCNFVVNLSMLGYAQCAHL